MNASAQRNGQQFLGRLLQAARATSQREVGEAVGWDASKTSRVLNGETAVPLDEALTFIAASGLALIPAENGDTITISSQRYRALVTLAGERMAELEGEGR